MGKINEVSLPETESFYSHSKMDNITDADYSNTKRDCKDFEIKNLGKFDDFCMCLKLYKLDPENFFSAPGLAWQAALKKIKLKLDLWYCIDVLLMVEKGIRWGICHSIYLQKLIANTWTVIIKIKHRQILNIEM